MDALLLHRIHFAFTITYHYLFPQLTMGLALLIVILKTIAIRTNNERYNEATRFWARIFAINFLAGVVTGIPMEFQFGTNWSRSRRVTGGVIGQPLAMEGVFSFFLESAFLGLFLFGEKRLSKWQHWGAAFMVFLGSWISGFFIIVTNAWMQHPVAYRVMPNGGFEVTSFWGLLTNPWALIQYSHNMSGAVITASFVMCAVGAFYVLENRICRARQNFSSDRRDCGGHLLHHADFSHRRLPWTLHGQAPARGHGGHGRTVHIKKGRAYRSYGAARRRE